MVKNKQITTNFSLKEYLEGTAMPKAAIAMNYEYFDEAMMPKIEELLKELQDLRDITKFKFGSKFKGFRITAGLRTREWDISKKRSGNSMHTKYMAVDFQPICNKNDYMEIFNFVFNTYNPTWAGGFAKKEPNLKKRKKGFIHLDTRRQKVRWVY